MTEKVVPTARELQHLDFGSSDTVQLIRQAQAADEADHKLTLVQAFRKYKKAVFWSSLLSTALIMEGYDVVVINGFFGQPQFQQKYGTIDPATGKKVITAAWQSGLANSPLVGQLAGLAINGWASDRFGCRLTYSFFMVCDCCKTKTPAYYP